VKKLTTLLDEELTNHTAEIVIRKLALRIWISFLFYIYYSNTLLLGFMKNV